jgi:hypothetical protein
MKFQYRVNGELKGNSSEKDRAIRAARKAAFAVSDNHGIVHVEVLEIHDETDPEAYSIVHRDMVLQEDVKQLDSDDLSSIGMIVPGEFKIPEEKTKKIKDPHFKLGDHIMLEGELYEIVGVTDVSARAQPVRKKKVKIKDKLANKEREFVIHRRAVSLSPTAANVLTKEEVEIELKKMKEQENVDSRDNKRNDRSDPQQSPKDTGNSEGSAGNNGDTTKRKRGRPKGWRKNKSTLES